jgi:hypothetical protein
MTKVAHLLLFLLLTTCSTSLWAEKELPPEIQRMTDEAFQFYSSRQTEETIHRAVEEFVGEAEPSDDLTKMCIKM